MGAPECEEFLRPRRAHERVHLDTTMVFTDFFGDVPAATCCRGCATSQHKVLLGSDFPTIPYPYAHQLEGLARLDLGDDWLRAVCWHNGVRLLGETSRLTRGAALGECGCARDG